ncbi:MAG: hypothetical protein ACHQZQ_08210 [SAR324 cluster bacterium]
MISVRVDPADQRIELKVDQPVEEPDLRRILAEIKDGVSKMRPGWLMISDFRGLKLVSPKLDTYIADIQKTVISGSPRKIAVLLDSPLLKIQLGVGSVAVRSESITRRFENEQAWLAFIEAP